jgi:probable F420-dependent oxidoreductase
MCSLSTAVSSAARHDSAPQPDIREARHADNDHQQRSLEMKLGLYGACLGAMASPAGVRVAQLAERLGYESLWSGEHMALPDPQAPPSHRDPKHPFFDPIVGMTYLAAHTRSIRLGLGILILPQRHPVQLAKELATLDILSNGRLIVGVGVGYLEAEYRAVGVDFRTRVSRNNEYTEALRTLWIEHPPRYQGRFVTIDGVDAYPRPLAPGGPPLIVGGHSEAALRRAVTQGAGWIGFNLDPSAAEVHVQRLRAVAADSGADLERFEITVGTHLALDRDVVAEFAAAGVHRLIVTAEGDDIPAVEAIVERNAPERLLPTS